MIGFIGAGNMGFAMIKGIIEKGTKPSNISVYDKNPDSLKKLRKLQVLIKDNEEEVVNTSRYIFIGVKPNIYDEVLETIKGNLKEESVIVTIAAGITLDDVEKIIGNRKVVRTMPNTPALSSEGFTAVCFNENITEEETKEVLSILSSFGKTSVIEKEELINAYSAVSGSGPAYVSIMTEAMADAAVLLGVPRNDAYLLAKQTVFGTSKLLIDNNMEPSKLKDMVCSPGGTTIEGVRTLEERGFRSSLIECIVNTYKKNINIKDIR